MEVEVVEIRHTIVPVWRQIGNGFVAAQVSHFQFVDLQHMLGFDPDFNTPLLD